MTIMFLIPGIAAFVSVAIVLGLISAQEAASFMQRHGVLQQYGVTFDMLLSDTLDHYRTFFLLERLLQHPPRMSEQMVHQIPAETQLLLLQKYVRVVK